MPETLIHNTVYEDDTIWFSVVFMHNDWYLELDVKNKKPGLSIYKNWLLIIDIICDQFKKRGGATRLLALTRTERNQKFMHFLGFDYDSTLFNGDSLMVRTL